MELRAGYKSTEVGVIPNDWELKSLGEIFEFKNGLNKEKEFFGYGTPIVNYMDVFRNTGIIKSDIEGKVFLTPQEIKNYEVKKGDVFFTRTSETVEEIGVSTVVLEDLENTVFSGFVLRGRPKNSTLELTFKKYCFASVLVRKEITTTASYTTRALTNGRLLSNVKIPIPTKAEQTAIANALSDADALISSLEKLITKKCNIKQGAMQKLLQPKEGWEVKKLGEIAEVRDGTHQTPKYVKAGIPFYSVETVTNNSFNNTKFISEEEHKILTKSFKIEKGDILMTRIGSIGDCKLIDWDVNASFYVSLALLKIKVGFSANYICHYSKTEKFKKEADINSLQSAIPRKINLGPISNIKIELPDIKEQTRIASILSDMDDEITALETKLDKYRKIKLGMMQNLLTGKIRLV